MVKCIFCGSDESPHKGVHFITNKGNVLFFCSSKCRKNSLHLERDRRRVRWTEAYRIQRNQETADKIKLEEKAGKKEDKNSNTKISKK